MPKKTSPARKTGHPRIYANLIAIPVALPEDLLTRLDTFVSTKPSAYRVTVIREALNEYLNQRETVIA